MSPHEEYDSKGNRGIIYDESELSHTQKMEYLTKRKPIKGIDKLHPRINHAISQLPQTQQDVIKLVFFKNYRNLSQRKLAKKLGIPRSTFQSRLQSAIKKLHEILVH